MRPSIVTGSTALIVCLFDSFTTIVAMTMMLPFLPLDVEELGARRHAGIVPWSGIAYSASFFTAGGQCGWMDRGRP
jgi:hypothetical protein